MSDRNDKMVRVEPETHRKLKTIAASQGLSLRAFLAKLADQYTKDLLEIVENCPDAFG